MTSLVDLKELNVPFEKVDSEEEKAILNFLKTELAQVREKPVQKVWDSYWNEIYEKGLGSPTFFKKKNPIEGHNVLRYKKSFIKTQATNIPEMVLKQILKKLNAKYFENMKYFVEFGCGSGHNLDFIKSINDKLEVFGSDFAESALKILKRKEINAFFFDMYKPDTGLPEKILQNLDKTVFFTSGSLEQLGENWKAFHEFTKKVKPAYLIHIEPICEFYNENLEMDRYAIQFHKQKKYLDGYYSQLKKDQNLTEYRNEFGTLFDEGFNTLVVKNGI